MASRSATVLVIFVIAIIAFCLASVFGAMTGPITIIPNQTDNGPTILDNLSAITDGTGDTGIRYGNQNSPDHSSSSDSKSDSKVETTTDNSQPSSSDSSQSHVETTTDNSQSGSQSKPSESGSSSNVETVTAAD